jgi:hypothetical protein
MIAGTPPHSSAPGCPRYTPLVPARFTAVAVEQHAQMTQPAMMFSRGTNALRT